MTKEFGAWPSDFPSVMHFVDHKNVCAKPWRLLENHPDYDAAKNHEDMDAALRLVQDILNIPENEKQLLTLNKKYPNAIVVPIRAIEAGGKNRIPVMFAEYISKFGNWDIDKSIIQTNKVHRTGSDEWHRFAFRPTFDGEVKEKSSYILVDDVFSFGGSFNELRLFIEKNGGKVLQTAAMALGGHGDKIAPEPEIMKSLIDKHGQNNLESFLKEIDLYEGNYKSLTNPEAFALRRAPSLDFARDKIIAARCHRMSQMGTESSQEYKASRKIDPQTHSSGHEFHI